VKIVRIGIVFFILSMSMGGGYSWYLYTHQMIFPIKTYSRGGLLELDAFVESRCDYVDSSFESYLSHESDKLLGDFYRSLVNKNADGISAYLPLGIDETRRAPNLRSWLKYDTTAPPQLVFSCKYQNKVIYTILHNQAYEVWRFESSSDGRVNLMPSDEQDVLYFVLTTLFSELDPQKGKFERGSFLQFIVSKVRHVFMYHRADVLTDISLFFKISGVNAKDREAGFVRLIIEAYKNGDATKISSFAPSDEFVKGNLEASIHFMDLKGFSMSDSGCLAFYGNDVFLYLLNDDRGINLMVRRYGDQFEIVDLSLIGPDAYFFNYIKSYIDFAECDVKK
jgi:hypothetical protein